ncbi:TetR/AcrR family transcriptional regulator [Pseudonocardia spinosispora]|uniref:TetR/AcrR family transcriptional regulator n=1 Tax=Pseudonocardia spinosispora TaxID=103441 RepID=UPI0004919033|nr:TetR/AcrR family transcriptional regulator [Pseudonocardia spinosispora]
MARDTRTRMLDAATVALQRHGVAGMAFTEVLRDSGAARGAIYHHFPQGKAQLVAEATARTGGEVRAHLSQLSAPTPRALVEEFLTVVRPVVQASAEGGGCVVAAATVTADETLRLIAADAFDSWVEQLAGSLTATGMAEGEAADLATTLITLLEGAHVLCRARGSLEPFDRAARAAAALVGSRYP